MTEPRRANITDIAAACHVSRSKAAQTLKAAGLRRGKDGTYLFAKAVETIEALKDPAMSAGNRAAGRAEGASSDAIVTLANAKALSESARAKKLMLEVAQKEGRLIDRQTVIDAGQDVLAHIRVGLVGLAPRIAPRLLDKDAASISRTLTEEIENTLRDLADVDAFTAKTLGL